MSWTLDDLLLPENEYRRMPPMQGTNALELLDELALEWLDNTVPLTDLYVWSLKRLPLVEDNNFTYDEIEKAFMRRLLQFKRLLMKLEELQLYRDDPSVVDKTYNLQKVMYTTHGMVTALVLQFQNMAPVQHPHPRQMPSVVDDDEFILKYNPDKLTSFQHLVLHILKRIEIKGYRKCGDSCYRRVVTDDGIETQAFEYVCKIKDEVWSVQKEVSFKAWKHLTNPRDNSRAVVDHLIESNQQEFPLIDVGDGHYYSFNNGIYDIYQDIFFPYQRESEWEQIASQLQDIRGRDEPYALPDSSIVCVNHLRMDFPFDMLEEAPDFDPFDISTPSLDFIFDHQEFDRDTRYWICIFLGRMFFLLHTHDNWQRALMFQGAGGTGKSTIANWIQHVIPLHHISIASSNMEKKFGWSSLTGDEKRLCLITECAADMSIHQETWQLAVEGAVIQVADKGLSSRPYKFKQPMFMAGNCFPLSWKNNARQISRRIYLIIFRNLVPKANVRTRLLENLKDESAHILRKCTALYIRAAKLYGDQDVESPLIMPAQVRDFMATMETTIDVLSAFIQSGRFVLGPLEYMPMKDFKAAYFQYRKDNGFPIVQWTVDAYSVTFQANQLNVRRAKMSYNGAQRLCDFIIGIRPADEDEDGTDQQPPASSQNVQFRGSSDQMDDEDVDPAEGM